MFWSMKHGDACDTIPGANAAAAADAPPIVPRAPARAGLVSPAVAPIRPAARGLAAAAASPAPGRAFGTAREALSVGTFRPVANQQIRGEQMRWVESVSRYNKQELDSWER